MLVAHSFLTAVASVAVPLELAEQWSVQLGRGFSPVAVADDRAIASYRIAGEIQTRVLAVEVESGAELWRASFDDPSREGQEDYGGGKGPHATPLVHAGNVYVLGYGGGLHSFALGTGEAGWSVDLVEELGAKPVQFGFAASPIVVEDRIVVQTGGSAGVTAFHRTTGEVEWRSSAAEASYVTPVLVDFDGAPHVVCLLRDATVGLDPSDGTELWQVPHVRPGLTNFAMVSVLSGGGIVVSGQGLRGARRIDVQRAGEGWKAAATWTTRRAELSHGRTVEQNGVLYGSTSSQLYALDSQAGSIAFSLRGFGESNWMQARGFVVRLDESGQLTLLRPSLERIEILAKRDLLKPKAWAPPTLVGDLLIARDAERMVALRLPDPNTLSVLETVETGYEGASFQAPACIFAYAHGSYLADGTDTIELRAVPGELRLVTPGSGESRALVARSETVFESADGDRIELLLGDSLIPTGLRWTTGERQLEAQRQPWIPMELTGDDRTRPLGDWRVADAIDLALFDKEGALRATSSSYPDVTFSVQAESKTRLWMKPIDANYGIPTTLLELDGESLWVHHADQTLPGVRP